MRKALVLAATLAVFAGVLAWQWPELERMLPLRESVSPAEPQVAGRVEEAPSGEPAEPQPPAEVVQEHADSESTLESFIPRRSEGHAKGLHKAPSAIPLGSSAVLVTNAASREVLLAKNADEVLPMASITKLMTGMVVLEGKLPMDQPITISEDDIDRARMSRSRLRAGTVLSRAEALQLALMSSENRAAHALGRTYPGGMPAFVAAMNRKAKQLGMNHTTYVDPTGLSESNRSTARDLATLVMAASEYPLLREYSTAREHRTQVAGRALLYRNSNPLIRDESWDITLQKTGYIIEAGNSVVLRTKLQDKDLVVVILDAGDNRTRTADARRIRNWVAPGFEEAWARAHPPAPKVAKAKDKSEKGGRTAKKKGDDKDEKVASKRKGEDRDEKRASSKKKGDDAKTAKSGARPKGTKTAEAAKDEKPESPKSSSRVSKSFKAREEPTKEAKAKRDEQS
jgi:D-alanyl-D-alanine endopeptidase (penicillin-binding protein 7)